MQVFSFNIYSLLSMGDYGVYVWSSYFISLALLLFLVVKAFISNRVLFEKLKLEYVRKQRSCEKK